MQTSILHRQKKFSHAHTVFSMRYWFLIILSAVFVSQLTAQNARFSQIASAPITLNPSLSGRSNGGAEISILSSWQNSRKSTITHQYFQLQWKSDLRKIADNLPVLVDSISYKGKRKIKKIQSYWGGGFYYYQYGKDMTGFVDNTTPVKASFTSAAIAKHFYAQGEGKHYFGFGSSVTFASGKADEAKGLVYDKEISGGAFTYRTVQGVNNRSGSKQYFDFNIGMYYAHKLSKTFYEIGASVSHWHYPQNSFFNDEESRLRHRGVVHGVFGTSINNRYNIVQRNVFWSEGLYFRSNASFDSSQILTMWNGIELKRKSVDKGLSFDFGLYSRSFRTILPLVTAHFGKSLDLKLSQEWPVNSSRALSYTAVRTELFLSYTIGRQMMNNPKITDKYFTW